MISVPQPDPDGALVLARTAFWLRGRRGFMRFQDDESARTKATAWILPVEAAD